MTFVPDISTLLQFGVATVILALTPGPDMTLFVSRALSQGRGAGFAGSHVALRQRRSGARPSGICGRKRCKSAQNHIKLNNKLYCVSHVLLRRAPHAQ